MRHDKIDFPTWKQYKDNEIERIFYFVIEAEKANKPVKSLGLSLEKNEIEY